MSGFLKLIGLLSLGLCSSALHAQPPSSSTSNPGPAGDVATAAPAVAFRLAQTSPGLGLMELRLPQRTPFYYVDAPVLVREDLSSVTAMRTAQGQAFVRLQFNEGGKAKLASVSKANVGRTLLLTINDHLIGAPLINRPISNGVLDLTMASEAMALQVSSAIVGGPMATPGSEAKR